MAADLAFYQDMQEVAAELIEEFGNFCKVKCIFNIINPNKDVQTQKVIFNKEIGYIAKDQRQFLIQDRFYEEAEVAIVIVGNQFKFMDKYDYWCEIDKIDYKIIRHRSTKPGPLEVIVELALRRSGSGNAQT